MYLDDVVIFSKNVDDHIRAVDEVMTVIKRAERTLNLSKSSFVIQDLM